MGNAPPKLLNRTTARGCLLVNLMVPGLGTLITRRRSGLAQVLLSQTGFGLTLIWGIWFATTSARTHQLPTELGPFFKYGVAGAIMFLIAWTWSLASSLSILRRAK